MRIMGIDPGVTGAYAVIRSDNGWVSDFDDLPVVAGKLDARGLHAIVQRWDVNVIVIEKTHAMPKNGTKAAYSQGDTNGVIRATAAIEGIRMEFVLPSEWKKHFGLTGKDKDASRARAMELRPMLHSMLARKKDHNRAEALLIATYAHETLSQPHEKVTA